MILNLESFLSNFYRFEEYRRKAQQEIEEEERKEKEKILAAQRRAARMRALQEEAALKAHREAENRTERNVYCSSGTYSYYYIDSIVSTIGLVVFLVCTYMT